MRNRSKFRTAGLLLLVLVVFAGGCTARHIREAQDSFSQGAAEENRLFAAGYPAQGVVESQAVAETCYRLALAAVTEELATNQGKLESERLYGSALMLKAYCLWRLIALQLDGSEALEAELESTRQTLIALSKADPDGLQLGDRDRVMIRALPKLLDHERGLQATDWATAEAQFRSAAEGLEAVAKSLPENSALRVYLRLAQLSTYRAWQAAGFALLKTNAALAESAKRLEEAAPALDELGNLAAQDRVLKKQLNEMRQRLGLNVLP